MVLVPATVGSAGSCMAQALLVTGHEVIGIDRSKDYYPVALKNAHHVRLGQRDGRS